jgi:diadenosine tetraphosphate (Ap4A) HIT family hydrolase
MRDCFVCDKHRGNVEVPGGAVYEDELVYVSHMWGPGSHESYLGYLFIEPRRHVPGLADLTPEEGERVGSLMARLSLALREAEGAEHVYTAVIGHNVPHLHVHLAPRYPGTPEEYWWTRLLEWPGAPRGGPDEVAAVVERVRAALG